MGFKFIMAFVFLLPTAALAQKVGLQVDGVNATENTTIEIKKNDRPKNEKSFEITEGTDEITGEFSTLLQDARKNWKTACEDWKKELKDLNKENQVLFISCGRMTCSKQNVESSCQSVAKYKLRVQLK